MKIEEFAEKKSRELTLIFYPDTKKYKEQRGKYQSNIYNFITELLKEWEETQVEVDR
ncbi:MAG: hypothetical protein H8E98_01990 [Bacteroidetes bacterium]|nr:hypothetical protein [Bacteroidota bacterium]